MIKTVLSIYYTRALHRLDAVQGFYITKLKYTNSSSAIPNVLEQYLMPMINSIVYAG